MGNDDLSDEDHEQIKALGAKILDLLAKERKGLLVELMAINSIRGYLIHMTGDIITKEKINQN